MRPEWSSKRTPSMDSEVPNNLIVFWTSSRLKVSISKCIDFLINSENVVMYEKASAIEFFFSVWIVVCKDINVPTKVSRLIEITSLPVSDRVMRCRIPFILFDFPGQGIPVLFHPQLFSLFTKEYKDHVSN